VSSADQLAHPLTPTRPMGWAGAAFQPTMPWTVSCTNLISAAVTLAKGESSPRLSSLSISAIAILGNLALLGPSSGYGGLGSGAGRIMALNVSVGVSIAAALAEQHHTAMASIYSVLVAKMLERRGLIVGCLVR